VKDKKSGMPREGIRVERYQRVSGVEKIVNPIGSTYHPYSLAESILTNTNGQATFRKSGSRDSFQIYPGDARPILVSAWGKELALSPETNQPVASHWGYSVWLEQGVLRYSAWPVKK
jgi:hypothetical protein